MNMRYKVRTTITILTIIFSTILVDVSWKYYAENSARIQAKYNLKQTQSCVNDLLLNNEGKTVNNESIEKALKVCAKDMRVSPTGDMFAYDLRTKEFIFDPSLDCFVEGGKYMTEESECNLHNDKDICRRVLRTLTSGYDSDQHQKVWWKFDNAREYLEWVILPSEQSGFDYIKRGGILQPHQVVLVQGVKEDEIWERYNHFRILLHSLGFLSVIFVLLLDVKDNYQRGVRNAEPRDL